ncbi:MAG: phosphoserine transaminase [Alphaproteobacteria bacterium]
MQKPARPFFSSGPCVKPRTWTPQVAEHALLGRSHRSQEGMALSKKAIQLTREVLKIPDTHKIMLTPGSATGAIEMMFWNLLGARGTDMFSWDVFGQRWTRDLQRALKLQDLNVHSAEARHLPDLSQYDPTRDTVFNWNGTTTGVWVPDGNWIADDRDGLVLCDAASAVGTAHLPWDKLDAIAFSPQKAFGSEAAFGILVLSPKAIERLQTYQPAWPVPTLLTLQRNGKVIQPYFDGATVNTISMLALEDYLFCLEWCQDIGGIDSMVKRSRQNFAIIEQWVQETERVEFMAIAPETRASSSICLSVKDADEAEIIRICTALAQQKVAYDVKNHGHGPLGLRIWGGPTVDAEDIKALLPWITAELG